MRGFALMIILLLSPTGVASRSLGGHGSQLASRTNSNLRLHERVGRGVLVCYDQQLVEGLRLVAEKLVLEEGAFSAPGCEVLDGLHLMHALTGVPKLGPTREVVAS